MNLPTVYTVLLVHWYGFLIRKINIPSKGNRNRIKIIYTLNKSLSTLFKLKYMRKVSTKLPLIILAFLCFNNYNASAAEPVFNLNGGSICEDATVEVDITVADVSDLISFQFTVGWDPLVMQIDDVTYKHPIIANDVFFGAFTSESEVLTVSWFDNELTGKNIDDDEILFTMTFSAVGDNSALTTLTFLDDPTMREVSVLESSEITLTDGIWNDDMVMIAQPELGSVEITDDVNMSGVGAVDVTMTTGTAPYVYAWESGQTTEDLVDVPMGSYNCTVTDDKGCVTEIGPFTVDNTVGIYDIDGLTNVQLFPNPTSGRFNLSAQLENPQDLDIIIYNILGDKVFFEQTESANIDLDLDLSDLATGNYIVQMRTKDGMHVQKLQIHR